MQIDTLAAWLRAEVVASNGLLCTLPALVILGVWGRADGVVWLDYPFPVTFRRLVRRTIVRVHSGQQQLEWESRAFWRAVPVMDSLIVWAVTSYRRAAEAIRQLGFACATQQHPGVIVAAQGTFEKQHGHISPLKPKAPSGQTRSTDCLATTSAA